MVADTFSQVLNWAVPLLLVAVVVGFVYIKFLKPWVWPMLQNIFGWAKGKEEDTSTKELTFE